MLERFKVPVSIASLIAIAMSVVFIWRSVSADHPSFGEQTNWACAAGHRFQLTVEQIGDHHRDHYGQPIPCPTCGSTETFRAPAK